MSYNPKCWERAEFALKHSRRVLFYGVPGTGKTFAGLNVGVPAEKRAYRLICTEDMSTADVVGMHMPNKDGGFTWHNGAALSAWLEDTRLVIDEVDLASGDVLSQLLAMTDSAESAQMVHPETGEIVKPGPNFSVVCTTNMEDPDELPAALRDRFTTCINITHAHPAAIAALPDDLQALAASMSSAEHKRRVSVRGFQEYAHLRKFTTANEAAEIVFGEAKAAAITDALKIEAINK